MKDISQAIADFVADFDLNVTGEGVCFDALLLFETKYLSAQVESEVHIVSVKNRSIDTIQILNPSLGIESFPTLFEAGHVDIVYQPKKGLIIRGTAQPFGQYRLIIHPVLVDCNSATQNEIRARYYN